MNQRFQALALVVATMVSVPALAAPPFDRTEYAARRSRLMDKVPDGAAVFLNATSPTGDYEFRQGHDFFYFTGVEIPDAFLVIDGTRKESVLFFTKDDSELVKAGALRALKQLAKQ